MGAQAVHHWLKLLVDTNGYTLSVSARYNSLHMGSQPCMEPQPHYEYIMLEPLLEPEKDPHDAPWMFTGKGHRCESDTIGSRTPSSTQKSSMDEGTMVVTTSGEVICIGKPHDDRMHR